MSHLLLPELEIDEYRELTFDRNTLLISKTDFHTCWRNFFVSKILTVNGKVPESLCLQPLRFAVLYTKRKVVLGYKRELWLENINTAKELGIFSVLWENYKV
jgi:hypothetical protein